MKNEFNEDRLIQAVLGFIGRFSFGVENERTEVIEAFTCGCCYWFAFILKCRFIEYYNCGIMIDYIQNHFGCKIEDKVFDITGDVTDKYKWEYWSLCEDPYLKARIIEDCINF